MTKHTTAERASELMVDSSRRSSLTPHLRMSAMAASIHIWISESVMSPVTRRHVLTSSNSAMCYSLVRASMRSAFFGLPFTWIPRSLARDTRSM